MSLAAISGSANENHDNRLHYITLQTLAASSVQIKQNDDALQRHAAGRIKEGRVSVAGNRNLIPTDPVPAVSYQIFAGT